MKFKVIDTKTGEIVRFQHSYLVNNNGTLFILEYQGAKLIYHDLTSKSCPHYLKGVVACQHLGKQDSNGDEIYDGCVVKDKDGDKFIVEWDENVSGYILRSTVFDYATWTTISKALIENFKLTIVGNIWDENYKHLVEGV